jgi:hypothetical protein
MEPRIRSARPAAVACAVALAGMAYCHIRDVGMKFDEHVYYMAGLFLANIALSLALIPLVLAGERLGPRRAVAVWVAAGALAALTIAGFLWSRTIGFPQMSDHIGQWDALGLTSLAFEGVVVATSLWALSPRAAAVAAIEGRAA